MKGTRSIFLGLPTIVLCCALLSSCSVFRMFGNNSEHAESERLEDSRLQDLESEQAELSQTLADSRQENARKDQTISDLELKISKLEQTVKDLEKRNAEKKPAVIQLEYLDPIQLYQKARNLLLEGDAVNAAQLFKSFATRHPHHSLADNALYWLGECHYTLGQYAQAIEEFQHLIKTYPKAEKVPDALLKIGYSFLSLDDINRAGHYLKLVLKKYPFSLAAEKAQVKLKSIE